MADEELTQTHSHYFILTGAIGGGKSTLIHHLKNYGVTTVSEPARQILAEQRRTGGDGVPEKNPTLFTSLLLSQSIFQFNQMQDHPGPVIFDRGIPDNISYASLFQIDEQSATSAARHYRYNTLVFFTPGWQAIYKNDDERKLSYEQAKRFGDHIKTIYKALSYRIVDLPFVSPDERADFIMRLITDAMTQNK